MPPFQSLRRRIVIAYLLFAVAASALFAVIAAAAVEGIEMRLVDDRLEEVAAWIAPRYAGHLAVEMPAGLSFHHDADIPVSLRGLPDGAVKVTAGGVDLHVFTGHDTTGDFVVVDHNSAYDTIELEIYSMFAVGFVGFLLSSLLFGAFVGKGLVARIMNLTAAVEARRTDLPSQDQRDELGVLARAFAARTTELTEVLDRERFFTGDVSHELRTPLTVITGLAEILLHASNSNTVLHAASERIYRAANDAANSVGVLLRLARSPERRDLAPLPFAALAEAECLRCQPLTQGRALVLRYVGGADFEVSAPRELLVALLGNLVRNACQYTTQGEVLVLLGPRLLVVEDSGPGLPAAARARLACRPAPDDERGSAGTGLGLSLVQRICTYLEADLTYRPRTGGGSVFEVRFA
jgi:signal transduction histidine kinase